MLIDIAVNEALRFSEETLASEQFQQSSQNLHSLQGRFTLRRVVVKEPQSNKPAVP